MGLNKSTGNMYEFITHTWNTVKGECYHNCSYCYMHKWGKQNPVRFDENELKTDLGSGNFIFVGSSCDMWSDKIINKWIVETLVHCCKFDNNYFFQSKNPENINFFRLPPNSSVCTTIETNRHYTSIMKNSPITRDRAIGLNSIVDNITGERPKKYVTIEPIMDFDLDEMVKIIQLCNPLQVNIGADSGNNKLPEPSKDKVLGLIEELSKFTKVHLKSNLKRICGTIQK